MIDYEVEYNNRARVPEHAEIFARWNADAAAYRERMKADENAELGLAYGTSPRQTVDLFFPEATGHTPLALFIHGGYWRSLDASTFSHMAAGLNSRGIAVAVAGYDLCPQVTIGQIINQMRTACLFLWRRFGQRLMVYGHSAGGHLAACMVATDWKKLDPKAPADLVPAGYSISGLFDLAPADAHRDECRPAARRGRGGAGLAARAGRSRTPACSTRWSAARSPPSSCARAALSWTPGARRASRRTTRKCRARTISPWSIR